MGAYGAVLKADFKWVSGEEAIKRFTNKPQSHRLFCSNCGSCLLSHHELAPSHYFLSLGCLNSTDGLEIRYQQFTASKAHWAKLDPDIPSHDHQPLGLKDKYTGD